MAESEVIEIDLKKLFMAILYRWWIVLLAAVIGAGATFAVTWNLITPEYSATAKMYVNNTIEKAATISSGDISASKSLVDTYITIIRSDTVLDEVIAEIGAWYTPKELNGMLTANAINSTEVFALTVKHPNPELAVSIVNTIASVAPRHLAEIVDGSSAKIVELAKTPTAPSSPDIKKNTAIGGFAGLFLAVIVLVLIVLFDVYVHTEVDLNSICELPILGVVSDFQGASSSTKYGYSYIGAMTSEKAVED
ncbi:chain-length determining protein [Clostridia bacterium]|nr:chain-length determining protein [Clostridia bacterium]